MLNYLILPEVIPSVIFFSSFFGEESSIGPKLSFLEHHYHQVNSPNFLLLMLMLRKGQITPEPQLLKTIMFV